MAAVAKADLENIPLIDGRFAAVTDLARNLGSWRLRLLDQPGTSAWGQDDPTPNSDQDGDLPLLRWGRAGAGRGARVT
jgi:hypothetical protein